MILSVTRDPLAVWEELHPAIVDSYVAMYGRPDEEGEQDMDLLKPPTGILVTATTRDGQLAGCAGWVWLYAQGYHPDMIPAGLPYATAELKRLFVLPEFRGRGLSTMLDNHRYLEASYAGVEQLIVETGSPQTSSVALRASMGYDDCPPFGHMIGNPESRFFGRKVTRP